MSTVYDLNQIFMDMREILDIIQWVIFTGLGYYLFDRHLGSNIEEIRHAVSVERNDRREDLREVRIRSEEILDRVHQVEQLVAAIQKEED